MRVPLAYMRRICIAILVLQFAACSSSSEPVVRTEYYPTAFRQNAPEPVYSRLTWSHLPQPVQKKAANDAPYLMPKLAFELPNSNLEETLQALAQTIGYRWSYPSELGDRRVSVKRVGTVEEILSEIGRQAGVETELDHEQRLVRAFDRSMAPRLPGE